MTEPARKVEYRYPSDEEVEAAWMETHRGHRTVDYPTTDVRSCIKCPTCGATYWRRRKQ